MHNTIPCNNLSTFSSTTFGRSVELKSEKEMQAMHCEEKHDDAGLGLKGPLPLKRPDGWKSEKAAQVSNVRWMPNSANKASWELAAGQDIWLEWYLPHNLRKHEFHLWTKAYQGLSYAIEQGTWLETYVVGYHWNRFCKPVQCSRGTARAKTFADFRHSS